MPTAPRRIAVLLLAATLCLPGARPAHAVDSYAQGLRLRASLDATPRADRTTRQYEQVLNAFRAVYHADRGGPNADASVEAVAELLAEEGRDLHNEGLLRSAVEQLEFLRRDFAASRFSPAALLTEGEIESRDLHDAAAASERFTLFLESYPRSALAPQARAELRRLGVTPPSPAVSAAPPAPVAPDERAMQTGSPSPAVTRERASRAPAANPSAPARAYGPATGSASGSTTGSTSAPADGMWAPPVLQQGVPDQESTAGQSARATPQKGGSAGGSPSGASAPGASNLSARPTRVVAGVPVYRGAGKLSLVTGVRHWSTASYTRIAIDLQNEVPFEASRVSSPDRIFFDFHGAKLAPDLAGRAVTVTDGGFLERIRAAQFSGDVVRVVLDVSDVSDYSAFWLPNPSRLIIDIHGRPQGAPAPVFADAAPANQPAPPTGNAGSAARPESTQAAVPAPHTPASRAAANGAPAPSSARSAAPGTFVAETALPGAPATTGTPRSGDSVAAIAALSQQPSRVRATRLPTTAPVASMAPRAPVSSSAGTPPATAATRRSRHTVVADAGEPASPGTEPGAAPAPGIASSATPGSAAHPAEPDAMGGRSMVRALGLKINRIVVDAGHGGHDSGTLGPGGLEEKDVVLDVALRLGKLLKQRLGADVIYTRDDDTFIPLETRTAIANKAQADLFISVHANSSPDPSARGVETYYLNFTTSADALEVAARENAVSDESIHQLSDLVKKITLQDKIAESREFAADVEGTLYQGLEAGNSGLKDRGVKKAPFVVLIGANMPSILAEISFLTNPEDAAELREGAYRQRIAESLYRGVARYERSLSGSRLEQSADGTR